MNLQEADMDPSRVTIVVPALNEAEAIDDVVKSLVESFPQAEILVIDDGSTDDTGPIAEAAGAKVIVHENNRGYGAALRTGVEAATGDYVLFCDSDGQHTAEDVRRVMEACDGYDMVVGARRRDGHVPLLRRPGKAILKAFADYLAGQKIPDMNSGLRAVRRDELKKHLHLMPRGFSFSTTCTFCMLKSDRRVQWVPIKVQKRVGKSTVRQFRHGMQVILLMVRLTTLFEPLKVFLRVAGGLGLLAAVMVVINLAASGGRHVGNTPVLLGLSSLLVFLFGLLADQVSAIRREFHDR